MPTENFTRIVIVNNSQLIITVQNQLNTITFSNVSARYKEPCIVEYTHRLNNKLNKFIKLQP